MCRKTLTAFVLACHVGSLLACWYGGYDENSKNKSIMLDPNNPKLWNGWNPPPGAQKAWDTWLSTFYAKNYGKGGPHDPNMPGHGKYPHGHNEKGWPADWAGMGPPIGAMAPPPWAYVPKNMGKPSFCYDPPEKGHCNYYFSYTRYGYNGFMDECQPFVYSGCGGNRNNFEDLESCEKACKAMPESGCDNDSKLPIDSWQWSRRCGYSDDVPNDYVDVRQY